MDLQTDKERSASFYGIVPDTNVLGDCDRPSTLLKALEDGYFIASNLKFIAILLAFPLKTL